MPARTVPRRSQPPAGHLQRSYRDEDALALLERGLALPGLLGRKDRMEALLRAGPLRRELGRPAEGTAALEEAVALADAAAEALPRARARSTLASHLMQLGCFAPALEISEAVLPLAREAGDAGEERRSAMTAGLCLLRLGRPPEAKERLERVHASRPGPRGRS